MNQISAPAPYVGRIAPSWPAAVVIGAARRPSAPRINWRSLRRRMSIPPPRTALDRGDIHQPDFGSDLLITSRGDVSDFVGPRTIWTVSCDKEQPDDPREEESARREHRE